MAQAQKIVLLAFILATTLYAQQFFSDYRQVFRVKKGLTFSATVWP